uniref:Uncharacterized protein n=1 Tax=Arundo donax TaxID=35708 RepID=A0A0A9CGC5_ARUDO
MQLQEVDMVIHKVTDEIVKIDLNYSTNFPKGISFSAGMSEIIRFVEEQPDFCIIDPFKNIYPLLDRLQIQQILVRLQELGTEGKPKLRAPYSLKVDNFHDGELHKQLAAANLSFPLIVKPQVACGVADAHNMVAFCLCTIIPMLTQFSESFFFITISMKKIKPENATF